MVGIVLLGIFVLLLAFGAPIAVCLGMSSLGAILVQGAGKPLDAIMSVLPRLCSSASSKFVLLAIPFFITAGAIMNYAGISSRLLDLADGLVGHLTGGLGHVNILLSVLMGGVSGSAAADASMEAKILVPAGFDIEIVEKHHNRKLDAPSGTALALADAINDGVLDGEYEYKYDRSQDHKKREKKEIGISAVRGGTIVGDHDVIFAGTDEVITFSHTAYSRAIFGKGAIQAAKYLAGKPAGFYHMSDVINAQV